MMPSMLAAIRTNINRGNKGVCLFELGKVYFPSDKLKDRRKFGRGEHPAVERMVLACGMAGAYMSRIWHTRERSYDFYDARGMLEALFEGMDVCGLTMYRLCARLSIQGGPLRWRWAAGNWVLWRNPSRCCSIIWHY